MLKKYSVFRRYGLLNTRRERKDENFYKKITICLIFISFLSINSFKVQAYLQANKPEGENNKSLVNQAANQFFSQIREMERIDGTLGVNSNIDPNNKYLDSSENGLDCHMIKSTEWGTVALLTASSYGEVPNGDTKNASTTGNNSGVFQMGDDIREYTTGITDNAIDTDDRYVNRYTYNNGQQWVWSNWNKINGDATEITNWYGNGQYAFHYHVGPGNDPKFIVLTRNNGHFFGYGPSSNGYWDGGAGTTVSSRAALVFGDKL